MLKRFTAGLAAIAMILSFNTFSYAYEEADAEEYPEAPLLSEYSDNTEETAQLFSAVSEQEKQDIYDAFSRAQLSELRDLFMANKEGFSFYREGKYNDSELCVIILEAYQRGYSDYDELDTELTRAAEKLDSLKENPNLKGLAKTGRISVTNAGANTNDADVFKFGGQEFIMLDKLSSGGETYFLVMTKGYYGTSKADRTAGHYSANAVAKYDDADSNNIAYVMTNQFAFNTWDKKLPQEMFAYMDVMHEWNVEPSNLTGFTTESVVIAPIALISAAEYKKYAAKIGDDADSGQRGYWLRTPRAGDTTSTGIQLAVAVGQSLLSNPGATDASFYIRPVFCIRDSFFKEQKLEKCGGKIVADIEKIVSKQDMDKLYTEEELKTVFGSGATAITPLAIEGDPVTGGVISAGYRYDGSLEIEAVSVKWQVYDEETEAYCDIAGAADMTYTVGAEYEGKSIRAALKPAFKSAIFQTGDEVFTAPVRIVTDSEYKAEIYNKFKNASLSELRELFFDNANVFSFYKEGKYTDSELCVIILEAYQKPFSSFGELDANITEAKQKLNSLERETKGLSGQNRITDLGGKDHTDDADVFRYGGKDFIFLDSFKSDGEDVFLVIAKDYYGADKIDSSGGKVSKYDDTDENNIAYKLTNIYAFNNQPLVKFPEQMMRYMDIMHCWNTEPSNTEGFTSETVTVGPIAIPSVDEYKTYIKKIGMDKPSAGSAYWLRTSRKVGETGNASHLAVQFANTKELLAPGANAGNYIRPMFYIKASFFKEQKLEKCGDNVTKKLDQILTSAEVEALYTKNEIISIFGTETTDYESGKIIPASNKVDPSDIKGNPIVGRVLKSGYTYDGGFTIKNIAVKWQFADAADGAYSDIPDKSGEELTIAPEYEGKFIRAALTPYFNSVILSEGAVSYTGPVGSILSETDAANMIADINSADTSDIEEKLLQYNNIFELDFDDFSENAKAIFVSENSADIEDVIKRFNMSVGLSKLNAAESADIREKAESRYLLGARADYEALADKNKLIQLIAAKRPFVKVSEFESFSADNIARLRFNGAKREDIKEILIEYEPYLFPTEAGILSGIGSDINDRDYKLGLVGNLIIGREYADLNTLCAQIRSAVAAVNTQTQPVQNPTQASPGALGGGGGKSSPLPLAQPAQTNENLSAAAGKFNDIGDVPWAAGAINSLVEKKILSGVSENCFEPNRPVTRNEFVKMIVSAFNMKADVLGISFADVSEDDWSWPYVAVAAKLGIISGTGAGNFGSGACITRQDMAVIAGKALTFAGKAVKDNAELKFTDAEDVSDYAVSAVSMLVGARVISGMDDGRFEPKANATRAMAAVVVSKLLSLN